MPRPGIRVHQEQLPAALFAGSQFHFHWGNSLVEQNGHHLGRQPIRTEAWMPGTLHKAWISTATSRRMPGTKSVWLGMYVMGRTLWDDRLDFEALADDYFLAAFGADGLRVRGYLAELTGLLNWSRLWAKVVHPDSAEADADRRADKTIRRFFPVIERNLSLPDRCHARSWEYLRLHTEVVRGLARIASFRARSDASAVSCEWEALKHDVQENEDRLQSVLDVYAFVDAYHGIFALQI